MSKVQIASVYDFSLFSDAERVDPLGGCNSVEIPRPRHQPPEQPRVIRQPPLDGMLPAHVLIPLSSAAHYAT